jgi:hypothetical protein
MKTNRKVSPKRKAVRRSARVLSLSQRVERLEKHPLLRPALDVPAAVKAVVSAARYVNLDANGNPTTGEHVVVRDRKTGLEWTAVPLEGGKEMNHADAMKACTAVQLLGHKDWRAPTIHELLSIVDYDLYDPAVPKAHFKGPYGWTWTSTPFKGNSGAAWFVSLGSGDSGWSGYDSRFLARAVRAGQPLGLLG